MTTHHRAILRRRDKDGAVRIVTPIAVGDTAEVTPAVVVDYLDAGWRVEAALHRDDDQAAPVNRFRIRYDGDAAAAGTTEEV